MRESFSYIEDLDKARERFELGDKYDLLLLFDVSSRDRICVSRKSCIPVPGLCAWITM